MTVEESAAKLDAWSAERDSTSTTFTTWPVLDPAALHGPAGAFVRAVEPHTEADPVGILVQFLALAGVVVGRNVYFEVEADRHHGNLFAAFVGTTAKGRKGTSWGIARRPFDLAVQDLAAASGLSSGEGLIWAVRDAITKVQRDPKTRRMEEVVVDAGVTDKRLVVVEEELASPLRVMRREGNTLSPVIRSAWDRGELRSLTKNTPARATGAHVALIGHCTSEELRRELLEINAANGFANRWLWLLVRRSKVLPEGGRIHAVDLEPTVKAITAMTEFASVQRRLERDDEAGEIWRRVYPSLSDGRPGMAGAMTARAEAQAMRLALIYAALDRSPAIRAAHLLAGLAITSYVEASVRHVFGDATGDRIADEILEALARAPDGLAQNDLYELFARNVSASRRQAVLDNLLRQGRVEAATVPTGGRPKTIWSLTADEPALRGKGEKG